MVPRFDVELISVSKRYGETLAVDRISLRIPRSSYCCLLGPSGCGKTSTLRMIAGHESITEGDIRIADVVVDGLSPRQRGTAMMFQSYALFPHLSCLDNVAFSLKMRGARQGRAQHQGARVSRHRPDGGLRGPPAGAALRRPAAARRARPRPDHAAQGVPAGRAAVGARSVPARADAPGAASGCSASSASASST